MKTLLTTCNAKYIHKNLAIRWIYTTCPCKEEVKIKEFTIKDDNNKIIQQILAYDVQVVCFSCYIWNIDKTKKLISLLKQQDSNIHIIVGGPEVSYDSFELIHEGVDAISIGEGEESIWEYIQMLKNEQCYRVKGMYTKHFPDQSYRRTDLTWLETFDDPYFKEMDKKDMRNRYFYLETSRGCPYGCTYCLSSQDRCVRMFSDDYVFTILEKIANSDIRQVKLLDRTFNAHPKRALAIAKYMNTYCKNQIFQFEIVAETLSEELLDFFCNEADIHRFRFEIGVQSFHYETLQAVGRIQNNQRLKEVIARLKKAGCTMHVDLIAGLPYEDFSTFHNSYDELFSLQADEVQLGILKLLKGTKLRQQGASFGFVYSPIAPYDIQQTNWLSKEELKQIHHCADATEKFWNSGMLKKSLQLMLDKKWFKSPFTLFMLLGEQYAKLPRPYQPYQLFQCVKRICTNQSEKEVDAILLMDYYAIAKQRPKRFTKSYIDLDKKKELLNICLEKGIANQDQLYRYGVIDIGYHNQAICYQLILFSNKQTYPIQYILSEDGKEIYEWKK